jgi:hypothetical protein
MLAGEALDHGSWDYIVALKYYRGVFTAAQLMAEQINNIPPPTSLPTHNVTSKQLVSGTTL